MEQPQALWFLLLLIPLVGVIVFWERQGIKTIEKIAGKWQKDRMGNVFSSKVIFGSLCMCLFLITCVLSMSGIKWGKTLVRDERRGLDIALVFDVSKSMLATDTLPSRFEKSKDIAEQIIKSFSGSRISVTAYRGKGVTLIPATEDTHALNGFVREMNIDIVTTPGTAITDGLLAAADSFPEHVESHKCIILFSDGEYHGENPATLTERFSTRGIIVVGVGLGTTSGSAIFLANGEKVVNDRGETVISKLNIPVLQSLARGTGGELFLPSEGISWTTIVQYLKRYAEHTDEASFTVAKKNRYRFFLLWALLFISVYIFVGTVKWHDTL